MKEMKILSIGGKIFEIVDAAARNLILSLTTKQDELQTAQTALETAINDKVSKADYSPIAATSEMTLPVGVTADGKLFTSPSESGITDVSLSATDDSAGNVTISVNTGG